MTLYSEGFGPRGFRVRIAEREPGGVLYWRHRDPHAPKGVERYIKGSLGHRHKQKVRTWALRRSEQLRASAFASDPAAHVARVFALHLEYATPKKVEASQTNDRRAAAMWTRILGAPAATCRPSTPDTIWFHGRTGSHHRRQTAWRCEGRRLASPAECRCGRSL